MLPIRFFLGMLLGLLWVEAPVQAATVRLRARVDANLQVIEGEIEVTDGEALRLVDALSLLPVPERDVELRRTFPFVTEQGHVEVDEDEGGPRAFHAILPRRYGASGKVPGRGLFMNGLWHPQPMEGQRVAVVDWQVDLELPPGMVGVLNGVVGEDRLQWSGRAERLALAVLPRGRVSRPELPVGELVIVDAGPPRRKREARLTQLLIESWPGPGAPHLVIVETPSRRRLSRPGPGTLFLSDRALRVTPPLWRYHLPAVRRGMLEAALPVEDPWERGLVAAGLSDAAAQGMPPVRELLGLFSWLPIVDLVLYDGRLPFYSESFEEAWPGDTVTDDLLQLFGSDTPPRVVAREVELRFGEGTMPKVADRVLQGESLELSLATMGVPPSEVERLRRSQPAVDHVLTVDQVEEGWRVTVERPVPEGTPSVPIVLQLGESRELWLPPPGPATWERTLPDRPKRVQLDPDALLKPQDRTNDRWPLRWTAVTAFYPYELTLRTGRISALAAVSFRRQYDTRWRYDLDLSTSPRNLLAAEATILHYVGPLQDRRRRPLRLHLGVNSGLLDPAFRPTDFGTTALGVFAGASWETRVDDIFPRRGHRLSLGTSAGFIPGSTTDWASVSASATGLLPLGGRATWANKVEGGLAQGDLEHRLLGLGGSGDLQGLNAGAAVGTAKAIAATELRFELIRHASVPVLLLWGSELSLALGAEAGVVETIDGPARAAGWTAGVGVVGDWVGARPTMMQILAAHPVWWEPAELVEDGVPEFYLRFSQSF